jgi:RNA polymerase sigma-70 factor (ECF subfamily)
MEGAVDTRALVARAQAGESHAFEALIERHKPRLASFIGLRVGDRLLERLELDDVFQEVLYQVFRSLPRFRWLHDGCFFPWLATVAEHVIQSLGRKHSCTCAGGARPHEVPLSAGAAPGDAEDERETREKLSFLVARGISPSKLMRQNERFERLKNALDALKPEHREVIILARVQGLSMKELAGRMNRSPEAVSALLLRALRQLKAAFGDTDSFHLPWRPLESPGEAPGTP